MEKAVFQDIVPGRLVPVDFGGVAFLPHPLPPGDYTPSVDVLERLGDAQEKIGELRGLTAPQLLPRPSILLRPLQREESLRSSSLEGTFATPEELLEFELQPEEPESATDPRNQRLEVANHDRALQVGASLVEQRGLTGSVVRELHQLLLRGVRGEDKSPGEYRQVQVVIGTNKGFVPPLAHFIPQCMDEFIQYVKDQGEVLHPILRACLLHYQFETIHPFRDGNGRIGRVLFSLMLANWCGLNAPWLYLSSYFEEHKDEYINGLFCVSTESNWDNWLLYCLHAIAAQAERTVQTCRLLLDLRTKWLTVVREKEDPIRFQTLIDALFETPVIDWKSAMRITGKSRNTAKADLEKLQEYGFIHAIQSTRPPRYFAPEVIKTVHKRPH